MVGVRSRPSFFAFVRRPIWGSDFWAEGSDRLCVSIRSLDLALACRGASACAKATMAVIPLSAVDHWLTITETVLASYTGRRIGRCEPSLAT